MCHLSLLSSLGLVIAPSIRRCNYDPFLTFPENHRWFPRGLVRTHCRIFPFCRSKHASSGSSWFTTALNRHAHPRQAICVLHVQPVAHPGGLHRSPPPTPRADSPSPLPRELLPSLCLQNPLATPAPIACVVSAQTGNVHASNSPTHRRRSDTGPTFGRTTTRGEGGVLGTGAGPRRPAGVLATDGYWVGSRLHWLR